MEKNKEQTIVTLKFVLQNDLIEIKEGSFANKDYYIVPSVMLVEGAFTPEVAVGGQSTALFFSGHEIGQSLKSWNGRPVSLYHPFGHDSCNDPNVIDAQGIGYIFNASYDTSDKKLRSDIWIEKDRGQFIIDKILKGDNIELSVGAYGDILNEGGTFNDIKYGSRMINIVGDHLAVLPDVKGACGWEDGCGIRLSITPSLPSMSGKKGMRSIARKPSFEGTETTPWSQVAKSFFKYLKEYKATVKEKVDGCIDTAVLSSKAKEWIASKSLLGHVDADTSEDLMVFPVVNPVTNKLNEGALRAVLSCSDGFNKLSEGARGSVRQMAKRLLDTEFANKEIKMEEKKETCTEVIKPVTMDKVSVPITMAELLDKAPNDLKEVITDAMIERENQRKVLTKEITAYEQVNFCSTFLDKTDTAVLRSIAQLVGEASKRVESSAIDYSLKANVEAEVVTRSPAPTLKF